LNEACPGEASWAKPDPASTVHAICGDHRMAEIHYVYILVSRSDPARHYTGLTVNLAARLNAHNAGQLPYTSKYKPWYIDVAIAFRSRSKARKFETYLKSHSGRAFASKHF
jgi:predicted GIY-YIG superfamily endonuclease